MNCQSRETLINCLHKRFAALGGAQKFAYLYDICFTSCTPSALHLILFGELISVSLALRVVPAIV